MAAILRTAGVSLMPLVKDPKTPLRPAAYSQYPRGYVKPGEVRRAADLNQSLHEKAGDSGGVTLRVLCAPARRADLCSPRAPSHGRSISQHPSLTPSLAHRAPLRASPTNARWGIRC